jgi:HK97 family phage portal protein
MTATARDSQLVESRKLTREEVAAAYHVPLPLVGILDHATFSNVKEQHKHLYQDCLGPWLVNLEEEIELQLLPEFTDSEDVYTEFNISEKLKGSFEEQTAALRVGTGAPFLSRNEARARLNLPRIAEAEFDTPVTNLNTLEGDLARTATAPEEDAI